MAESVGEDGRMRVQRRRWEERRGSGFFSSAASTFSTLRLLGSSPAVHASNFVANYAFLHAVPAPVAGLCSLTLPPTLSMTVERHRVAWKHGH